MTESAHPDEQDGAVSHDGTVPDLVGTDDSSAVAHDGSLSLQEAAERLGISERTMLRRVKKDVVKAYKADTPRGPVWRVILDGSAAIPDSSAGAVSARVAHRCGCRARARAGSIM